MRVELSGVTKKFGAVAALSDVSFALPSGGRCALIGPNGAGKSTLTRIVMGMLGCQGDVSLDDGSPFRDRAQLARRLAYVPQVAPRLGATVGELVRTVARLRGIPIEKFTVTAAEFDLDVGSIRRRSLRDLSGGMRQKLLLALALSSDAELLILDEPTASLDVRSRQRFFELVAALGPEPSILLCSHRLEEIRHLVDRVLVLEDGRVAFDGDANEYLRRTGCGVVEVMAESAQAMRWLADRGFRRGAAGWWAQQVRNGQRIELVTETLEALGSEVADIVVRDVDRVGTKQEGA